MLIEEFLILLVFLWFETWRFCSEKVTCKVLKGLFSSFMMNFSPSFHEVKQPTRSLKWPLHQKKKPHWLHQIHSSLNPRRQTVNVCWKCSVCSDSRAPQVKYIVCHTTVGVSDWNSSCMLLLTFIKLERTPALKKVLVESAERIFSFLIKILRCWWNLKHYKERSVFILMLYTPTNL